MKYLRTCPFIDPLVDIDNCFTEEVQLNCLTSHSASFELFDKLEDEAEVSPKPVYIDSTVK